MTSADPTPLGRGDPLADGERGRWLILLPLFALIASILLLAGCSTGSGSAGDRVLGSELAGVSVDVHKQVGCGCCDGWVAYVRRRGATVAVQEDPEIDDYRRGLGVPDEAAGCHIALIDGYVVEGHVPAPAIIALMAERPDLIGVAVPGMPPYGPGMGGDEATWDTMEILAIDPVGGLGRFDF